MFLTHVLYLLFLLVSETEAKFHTVVDRKPLRLDNEAWQRVQMSESMDIPAEFQAWVNAPTNMAALKTEEAPIVNADAATA